MDRGYLTSLVSTEIKILPTYVSFALLYFLQESALGELSIPQYLIGTDIIGEYGKEQGVSAVLSE